MECFGAANLVFSLIGTPTKSSTTNGEPGSFFTRQNPVDEERLRELWGLLEKEGLGPVLGGSLAAMTYSVGRITKDVDLNLAVNSTKFESLQQLYNQNPNFTDATPLFNSTAGKNEIRVSHTHFKYKGLPIDIYFNSNFVTQYAIENAVTVPVKDYSLRCIPPESVCSFKMANARKKTLRFIKDQTDVLTILNMVPELEFKRINEYVEQVIYTVQGPDSPQLRTWKEVMDLARSIRKDE